MQSQMMIAPVNEEKRRDKWGTERLEIREFH
jgi:hypothetical protein